MVNGRLGRVIEAIGLVAVVEEVETGEVVDEEQQHNGGRGAPAAKPVGKSHFGSGMGQLSTASVTPRPSSRVLIMIITEPFLSGISSVR